MSGSSPEQARQGISLRRAFVLGVGLFLAISILGYHRWGTIDAIQRLAVTQAIVHDGSVLTAEFGPVKYGLTQPVLMIPTYLLGYEAGRLVGSPEPRRVGYRFTAFLFSPLLVAATIALFARFGARVIGSAGSSVAAALVLLFSTPFLAYSRLLFTEPLNAFLLLLSFWFLEVSFDDGGRSLPAALGVQVLLALNNLPFAAILCGTIAFAFLAHPAFRSGSGRIRLGLYALASFLVCGGVWAVYDFARYGSAFQPGYAGETFSNSPLRGLRGLLFSVGRGLFLYAPVVVAALLAIRSTALRGWRTRHLALVLGLAFTLLYASWGSFEGGWCWGPRFLLPFLPLLLLLLVPRFDALRASARAQRPLDVALVLAGVAVSFLEFLGVYQEYERVMFGSGPVDYVRSVFEPALSAIAHSWDPERAISRAPQFLLAVVVSLAAGVLTLKAGGSSQSGRISKA